MTKTENTTCSHWHELMMEELLGDLNLTDKKLLQQHLQACEACRSKFELLQLQFHDWQQQKPMYTDEAFVQAVHARINAGFYQTILAEPFRFIATTAAAIVIGLAIGFLVSAKQPVEMPSDALSDYYTAIISEDVFSDLLILETD